MAKVRDAIIDWYWTKRYKGKDFQFSKGELQAIFSHDPKFHDIMKAVHYHVRVAYKRGYAEGKGQKR